MRSPETAMCWLFSGKSGTGNMVRKEKAFISITIWRWVTVNKGEGVIKLENGDYPYFPQTFTMIPKNCPHSTFGDQGGINSWEFLFIDVERFLADLYPGRSRLAEEISRRINSGARFLTHGKNPGSR